MTNRTMRKRYRRRESRLKATAGPDRLIERWGWGTPAPSVAGDLVLLRKAVNEEWDIPDAQKAHIIGAMEHLFDHPDTPVRVTLAAVRTVLAMSRADLKARRREGR